MKLSIKTETLKEVVGRSIKGAGFNKVATLSSYMAIQLAKKKLTLITTDGTNYLYIIQDNVTGDDFYAVVYADQFSKLISKMDCETISMELVTGESNYLRIEGNGEYKLELPIDVDGSLLVYPDPMAKEKTKGIDIDLSTIKSILTTVKPSLAPASTTADNVQYTRYYVGDKVMASDSYTAARLNQDLLKHDPVLISVELMNLLDIMTAEKIQFHDSKGSFIFASPDCIVYGYPMEGADTFAADDINVFFDEEYPSKCRFDKNALLAILDRIGLFVTQSDNKSIVMTFTEKGIDISSRANTGVETLSYLENEGFKPFTCIVDVEILQDKIKAYPAESVSMQYGNESNLKVTNGDITQIICLLFDEADQ